MLSGSAVVGNGCSDALLQNTCKRVFARLNKIRLRFLTALREDKPRHFPMLQVMHSAVGISGPGASRGVNACYAIDGVKPRIGAHYSSLSYGNCLPEEGTEQLPANRRDAPRGRLGAIVDVNRALYARNLFKGNQALCDAGR